MKVFVTGGSGFVGGEIVRQLHQAGYSARKLIREKSAALTIENQDDRKTEFHIGNILDANSLQGALAGIDAVIHLVGIISECGESTFENVHVRGTQNVLTAAQEQNVERFVHMSALGTRPCAISRYHKTKWDAEEIIRSSRLDYTIFRPSLIFGPQDHFVNLFARIIRFSPIVPIFGRRDAKFQPVAIQCVAAAFVHSLSKPKSIRQIYDLAGPDTFTMSEIINQILAVMQRKRLKLRVPGPIARVQARLFEFLFPNLLRKPAPLNRDQLIMLQEDNVGNPQPANELLGLRQIRFRQGIADYLEQMPKVIAT